MKDLVFLVYLIGLLLLPGCYGRPTERLTATVQEEIVISLESNPTTGYSWQLASLWPEGGLTLESHAYLAPQTELVGAGGVEEWKIVPLKSGTYYLYFVYLRPWEKDSPPAKEKALELKVLDRL